MPPAASRRYSSAVSRELVGTIGSSDKYKDKNKRNNLKYADGHKDKYKQAALDKKMPSAALVVHSGILEKKVTL